MVDRSSVADRVKNVHLPKFLTAKDPWKIYESENYVVLDFETTNRDFGAAYDRGNRLLLSTWTCGPAHKHAVGNGVQRVFHHWGSEFDQRDLLEAIDSADFIVAQNAKFELQWLSRCGIELHNLCVYDTMLGEYVRLGNRRGPKDLDSLCVRYGVGTKNPLVKSLLTGGVCPSSVPEDWLESYGIGDTRNTAQVFLRQRRELQDLRLLPILFTRCLTTVVLADIELRGVHVDASKVLAEHKSTSTELRVAEERLAEITGGINLASPKQVAAFLYDKLGFDELRLRDGEPDRTERGGRRTDEDGIKALKASTDEQKEFKDIFLTAKPLLKRLDYLNKLKGCVEEDNAILYGNINQAVTQTHRTSSSGRKWKLQFQNIDRDLKPLFSAREAGWLVGEADGSSLEFRGAGHLGRDDRIRSDIRGGFDPHLFTASIINGVSLERVTKNQRTLAKPDTFKPLYGGKSGTPAQQRYYKAFQEKYAQLYKTQTDWTHEVLKTGKLVTEWGMVFYWPNTKISRSGYIENTTSIFNYPIQSFCTAEIIPISLVYFWHRMCRLGLKMFLVNTVHDSIIAELPSEEEPEFREISKQAFTSDVYGYLERNYGIKVTIPLGCESKVGSHWGIGEEEKYNLDPDDYFKK